MEFNTNINFLKSDLLSIYKSNFKDISNTFDLLGKFIFKVIPGLKTQIKNEENLIDEFITPFSSISGSIGISAIDPGDIDDMYVQFSSLEKHFFINKEYIKSIYLGFPKVDFGKMITFMTSYTKLTIYLDHLCSFHQIKDKLILHQLFLSLLEAVDPAREISDYYRYFPDCSNNLTDIEKDLLKHFVVSCRNQIKEISSYEKVKEYIKKYVYIKKDFSIYRYSSGGEDKTLSKWADNYNYLKHYPDLFPWEFQAAACSDLGLYALLALAFDPSLEDKTVINVDKAYFPWINGLQILLLNYINLYQNIFTDEHNLSSCYDNLKQCEERLDFFFKQSIKVCSDLNLDNVHKHIVKLISSIYLSDPRAHTGLKKISSRSLSISVGIYNVSFWKVLISLFLTSKYQCTYPY